MFSLRCGNLLLTGCTEKTDESHGKPADIEDGNHSNVIIEKDENILLILLNFISLRTG